MLISPLKDVTISTLISEAKDIPDGLSWSLKPMPERGGHWQKSWEIDCDSGSSFVVKVRWCCANLANFSVILGYKLPGSYTVFRLRRYNGKSHFHTNVLERERFYDFHIHMATERYQASGFNEDHYAQRTDRYYDLGSAIQCLFYDCGFRSPLAGSPLFPKI